MKMNREAIPVTMQGPGTTLRGQSGYGGMTASYNEVPAGTDFSLLLQGLKNDCCPCPHWGYVVEGRIVVDYSDGSSETITTGDVFYLPPGHTARVEKDLKYIEFSPEKELKEVMDHIARKMAASAT